MRKHSFFTLFLIFSAWPLLANEEESDNSSNTKDVVLDVTTITGSEMEIQRTAGSIHALRLEELENFKYDDIHRVLSQVPGVYVREEDGYGLRPNIGIRGGDSERSKKVVLMEDGVLLGPAPYSATAAYYFPMVTRMTGVEVFKGPSAIEYGPNNIGGAINLQTRPVPMEKESSADLSIGTDAYGKVLVNHGVNIGKWGYVFDIIHLRSDGFKELDGGGDTGFDKTEGMLKLKYEPDFGSEDYHRFELKLGHSEETSDETYLGLRDDDFEENPLRRYGVTQNDIMDWDRQQIVLSHSWDIGAYLSLQTDVYHHSFFRSWAKINGFENAEFQEVLEATIPQSNRFYDVLNGTSDSDGLTRLVYGNNRRKYTSQGVQWNGAWFIGGTLDQTLRFGLRLHRDKINRDHDERNVDFTNGLIVDVPNTLSISSYNNGSSEAASAYLHHEFTWDKLTVTPGIRYEFIDLHFERSVPIQIVADREDSFFLPGLGLSYAIDNTWTAIAGVHKGFSPIIPSNTMNTEEAEESINYEGGFRYQNEKTNGELIAFYNDYSNILGEAAFSTGAGAAALGSQFSGGEVEVYGFELVLQHELENELGTFPFKLNYTYTETKFPNTFLSDFFGYERSGLPAGENFVLAGEPMPYIPEHLLQCSAGWQFDQFRLNFGAKYISDMQERASFARTDDFWNFDFSGSYAWNEEVTTYLKLENILNEQAKVSRRPYGARPNRPFQAFLGAVVDW